MKHKVNGDLSRSAEVWCKYPYAEDQSQEWHPVGSIGCAKCAPEDVQLDVEARELAQIAADGVVFLDPELCGPKGLFLCQSCGQCAEESKEQLEHNQDCPIGKLLALLRRVSGKGASVHELLKDALSAPVPATPEEKL